ncbi:MAG: GNAT family N-acetyltransferase [Planctomycetota bacterium]
MAESFYWRLWRHRRQRMTYREWHRFPRVADYKNEYWDGFAHYTARPKQIECYLPLDEHRAAEPREDDFVERHATLETRLVGDDWPMVVRAWQGAMWNEMPLRMWHKRLHGRIAELVVGEVRVGGDGPLMPQFCRLAILHHESNVDGKTEVKSFPVVAALVVEPKHAPFRSSPEVLESRPPMLDWIFVSQMYREHGIARRLIDEIATEARVAGHRYLASNAMLANPGSIALHWSAGFRTGGGWRRGRFKPAASSSAES